MPSPFLSMAEKSGAPRFACFAVPPAVLRSPAIGALGSPADWGLGVPPVGPLPTALVPEGPCARIMLSLSADCCAATGSAKAPATATTNNCLKFIQPPCEITTKWGVVLSSVRFTAINVPASLLR